MELLLNEFPKGSNASYLTVRRSKGFVKQVKIGAELVEANTLSILIDPFNTCNTFSLEVRPAGGIVLKQDPEGTLYLRLNRRLKLVAQDTEPTGNYLASEIRSRGTIGWTTKKLYVSLEK